MLRGEKSSEVRNADVNETGGDGTFHSNRCSCGHGGLWKFGCGPVGLKATLQTGSDTEGGGEQEVRGRALVFLLVRSHSLARLGSVLGQGRTEGGNRTTKSANDLN